MSLDVANGNERFKVFGQNSSLDNVLESNGLEEFSASFYKTKVLSEVNKKESEVTVDNNVSETVDEWNVMLIDETLRESIPVEPNGKLGPNNSS